MASNQPPQEPAQPAPAPAPAAPAAKFSAANDIMFEDCLKSIILKAKTGKTYTSYKNPYCPKPMQSPFGDFPPEYLPKKTQTFATALPSTTSSQMSNTMKSIFLCS